MSKAQINWLTIGELAERWRVSYDTILRQVKGPSPKIPSLVVGSSHRISREWIEQKELQAKQIEPVARSKRPKRYEYLGKDHFPEIP